MTVMAFAWSFGSFAFFVIPFYIGELKANIYYMALATEVAEALANFIMMGVTKIMPLKTALYMFCMLILTGTSVLFIYTSV